MRDFPLPQSCRRDQPMKRLMRLTASSRTSMLVAKDSLM